MARRGGFPGGGMPGNMNNLMKQAQRMQKQMEEKNKLEEMRKQKEREEDLKYENKIRQQQKQVVEQ